MWWHRGGLRLHWWRRSARHADYVTREPEYVARSRELLMRGSSLAGAARANLPHEAAYQGHAAGARQAADEHVLARRAGLQPESKGFDGALLGDDADDRLDFGR
jgi:hypothetical protein